MSAEDDEAGESQNPFTPVFTLTISCMSGCRCRHQEGPRAVSGSEAVRMVNDDDMELMQTMLD